MDLIPIGGFVGPGFTLGFTPWFFAFGGLIHVIPITGKIRITVFGRQVEIILSATLRHNVLHATPLK